MLLNIIYSDFLIYLKGYFCYLIWIIWTLLRQSQLETTITVMQIYDLLFRQNNFSVGGFFFLFLVFFFCMENLLKTECRLKRRRRKWVGRTECMLEMEKFEEEFTFTRVRLQLLEAVRLIKMYSQALYSLRGSVGTWSQTATQTCFQCFKNSTESERCKHETTSL